VGRKKEISKPANRKIPGGMKRWAGFCLIKSEKETMVGETGSDQKEIDAKGNLEKAMGRWNHPRSTWEEGKRKEISSTVWEKR